MGRLANMAKKPKHTNPKKLMKTRAGTIPKPPVRKRKKRK